MQQVAGRRPVVRLRRHGGRRRLIQSEPPQPDAPRGPGHPQGQGSRPVRQAVLLPQPSDQPHGQVGRLMRCRTRPGKRLLARGHATVPKAPHPLGNRSDADAEALGSLGIRPVFKRHPCHNSRCDAGVFFALR